MTKITCDVLVCGAGPTGLIAANLLRRSGLSVRIIEKRLEAARESRAFAVQARTLELLQSIGLSDEHVANGVMTTAVELHVRGKWRGGLNADLAAANDTPFPYILMIPQWQTEAILIDDLAKLGITVERGVELQNVEQSEDRVVSTIVDADGALQSITSTYVIGADGARSTVRDAAGLEFTGGTYPQSFLLADCKVDWPLDHQKFRVFINGRRIGLFLPLDGKSVSRVMATDLFDPTSDGNAQTGLELNVDEMQEALIEAAGFPLKLSDPIWVTKYKSHHKAVNSYRAGRVFVAGDAAHIHSPAGGQGMNTGLQDAANLAWKIAAVLKRGAPDELLDDYHDERKPVGEMLLKTTGRLFSAAAGQAGWRSTWRDWMAMTFLPLVYRLPPFHRNGFLNISERSIKYNFSRFVADGPVWPASGPGAGARVPNIAINDSTQMFDLIKGYRFNLIAFSRTALDKNETQALQNKLSAIADEFGDMGVHLISRLSHGLDENAVFAIGPDVFDAFGIDERDSDQALYLVRPDNYIAWRVSGMDFASCRRMLAEFCAPHDQNDLVPGSNERVAQGSAE